MENLKVEVNSSEEDMDAKQIIAERGFTVQKVNFKDAESKDCYACILMKKADEEKFRSAFSSGKVKLEDYGQILFSGFGKEIPEFEKVFLDEMFGKGKW